MDNKPKKLEELEKHEVFEEFEEFNEPEKPDRKKEIMRRALASFLILLFVLRLISRFF